jgi:hypothetical protein
MITLVLMVETTRRKEQDDFFTGCGGKRSLPNDAGFAVLGLQKQGPNKYPHLFLNHHLVALETLHRLRRIVSSCRHSTPYLPSNGL